MKKYALIVDDMEINREILSDILEDNFDVLFASNGLEALEQLSNNFEEISIVLLDIMMPMMDGFETLKIMKKNGWADKIPVIIISSEKSADTEQQCFDEGIVDFVGKPFERNIVERRVKNAADLFQYKNHLEEKVKSQTRILREQNKKLLEFNKGLIESIADIVEARSLESGLHVKRVVEFTKIIATRLMNDYPEYGLNIHNIKDISQAAAVHDVGKIMISDAVLLKPGRLTPEEFEYMKTHSALGCEVLKKVSKLWDPEVYKYSFEICRHHHEKYDGRGYPDKLVGDDIPISAQIVSVCDCYDALTSDRSYKKAFTSEVAYNMILNGECGQFNPKIIACFVNCRDEIEELAKKLVIE